MPTAETTTVRHVLEFNARHFPAAPALSSQDVVLSNRALYDRGQKLASAFELAGLLSQDRVAILSRNRLEFMEVYAAGWLSGIIVATVNFRLAEREIAFIVNDGQPSVLVFESIYLSAIDQIRAELTSVEHFICIEGNADWAVNYETFLSTGNTGGPSFQAQPSDIANLIYTSGTTGRPKGCVHGQRELARLAQTLALVQPTSLHESFLAVMPLFHIGAMAVALAHLSRTGTVHIAREFEARSVLDLIERERIGMILLAPTMVQMLLDAPGCDRADLSSLRRILYSASPMPSNTLRRGIERFGAIFTQYYGQTEVISTYLPSELHVLDGTEEDRARLLSAGIPFPDTRVRIVDDRGATVPVNDTGEVVTSTPAMARGFWSRDAATIETFRDGWCRTGDIGRIDDRGFLTIVDRKKDVIISGGENVYSREVEETLLLHPAVAEVAVVGRPDPVWGEAVCAVVRLTAGLNPSEQDLIDHVRQHIASYKKPKAILFVDELPKLVSGKVNKLALRGRLVDAPASG